MAHIIFTLNGNIKNFNPDGPNPNYKAVFFHEIKSSQ
jgi:hypothetical protein